MRINVGRITKEMRMKNAILDDDVDIAATAALTEHDDGTAALTELIEQLSKDNTGDEDEDFAIKNVPRPPPENLLYNGQGTSSDEIAGGSGTGM